MRWQGCRSVTELRVRNSELAKFMRCPRSWYLAYYRNLEPDWSRRIHPQSFDTGNAAHAGLFGYFNDEDPVAHIEAHRDELYAELHPQADMKAWDKTYEMAHRMVEHFPAWLEETGLEHGSETVTLEERLEISVGNFHGYDVTLHGQPDRIRRTAAGLIISDWKTGDVDRPFLMESDWQLLNYIMMSRTLHGEMPVGAEHVRLKRSMHTARAKSAQYGHHMVSVPEHRLRTHWQHVHNTIDRMIRLRVRLDEGASPVFEPTPNRLTTCSWDCSFTDVCPLMDDDGDWQYLLQEEFRLREDND